MKTCFLLLFLLIVIHSTIFAIEAKKVTVGNTVVELGVSTKDISNYLISLAETYKSSFAHIYGQYRKVDLQGVDDIPYILIALDKNEKDDNFEITEQLVKKIASNVASTYPGSKGRIEVNAYAGDIWNSMTVEFENQKIIQCKIIPEKEKINNMLKARSEKPESKLGLSEEQRKKIAKEYDEMDAKAKKEADIAYPWLKAGTVAGAFSDSFNEKQNQQLEKYGEYYRSTSDKYEQELLKKYNITKEQLKAIDSEGVSKGWY